MREAPGLFLAIVSFIGFVVTGGFSEFLPDLAYKSILVMLAIVGWVGMMDAVQILNLLSRFEFSQKIERFSIRVFRIKEKKQPPAKQPWER